MNDISSVLSPFLSSLLASAAVSAGVASLAIWLFRSWVSERLQQSIRAEYALKLETHKAELNSTLQKFQQDHQIQQQRTALFFEPQRNAFASLTAKIAAVNEAWSRSCFDPEEGVTDPIPSGPFDELLALYHQHQLFLDPDCDFALSILFACYRSSFPVADDTGYRSSPSAKVYYDRAHFLQPLIADLFRAKIGVSPDRRSLRTISLLGALLLLNNYHFQEAGTPPTGPLSIAPWQSPASIVQDASSNLTELLAALRKVRDFLSTQKGSFPEVSNSVVRYLEILDAKNP